MEDSPENDIVSLCSRVGVNPSSYRRFRPPLAFNTDTTPRMEPEETHIEEHVPDLEGSTPPLEPQRLSLPDTLLESGAEGPPARRPPREFLSVSGDRNLLHYTPPGRSPAHLIVDGMLRTGPASFPKRTLKAPRERAAILPVVGAAAGCGATAVTACLARALAISGYRVLAAEASDSSLLPPYLGVSSLEPGQTLAIRDSGASGTTLYLMEIGCSDPAVAPDVWESMDRLAGHLDQLVVSLPSVWLQTIPVKAWPAGTCLIVVTPEARAVAGAVHLWDRFTQAEGGHPQPYFLLNRFDETLTLHIGIQSRLREALGDRLLPITIPSSLAMAEALETGRTIVDAAPRSEASAAFFELSSWYTAQSEGVTQGAARGA